MLHPTVQMKNFKSTRTFQSDLSQEQKHTINQLLMRKKHKQQKVSITHPQLQEEKIINDKIAVP